jgi:hypothetical protein
VTARPILFSAQMVRALLDDRKTQTRRIVKFIQGSAPCSCAHPNWHSTEPDDWHCGTCGAGVRGAQGAFNGLRCPYGVPGDTLWVRESAWYDRQEIGGLGKRVFFEGGHVRFDSGATGQGPGHPDTYTAEMFSLNSSLKKRPGIHMPRWASRITLRVTDVRVQRLQEISEADALAEGVEPLEELTTAVGEYSVLWDQIHGPDAWNANPWVWAISFERIP